MSSLPVLNTAALWVLCRSHINKDTNYRVNIETKAQFDALFIVRYRHSL